MSHFSKLAASLRLTNLKLANLKLANLKRLAIVVFASAFMFITTACSSANAQLSPERPVPEASQADIERAQGNLSDEAINENVLSKQGVSRANQSNRVVSP